MKKSARLFNCARCSEQVIICSDCDRGNIYCGSGCSRTARLQSLHRSNQSYQKSLRGRQKHAGRQRRYRQRQIKKVTDQGSPILSTNDLLPNKPNDHPTRPEQASADYKYCHFCGKPCSSLLRWGYLRHSANAYRQRPSFWPRGP